MELKYDIEPINLDKIEVKEITLDKDKFGSLTFDRAYPQLEGVRNMLVELRNLGYKDSLTPDEANQIDRKEGQLLNFLKRIYELDPATNIDFNKNVRDNVENEIESFYNDTVKSLRNYLTYLRNESILKTIDKSALAESQKIALEIGKQTEALFTEVQHKLRVLEEREKEVEATSGKLGAKILGLHFGTEFEQYQKKANIWFRTAVVAYFLLLIFVIAVTTFYSLGKMGGWENVTWQAGAAKLVLFAALWYGVSFIVRNYNVNSHLAAVNRHRAAVASTLEDFLASNPHATGEMLQNGTEAMFKQAAIGFITKAEKDSGNPLLEIVNKIVNPRSE
jgi:hypothetical protein